MRNASLIQSALGKNCHWEVASIGKEVSDDRRLLILEILRIPYILLQTIENAGKHTCLPQPPVARFQTAPTGDYRSARGFPCERLQTKEDFE